MSLTIPKRILTVVLSLVAAFLVVVPTTALAQPTPTVSFVDFPTESLIGEPVTFTVGLDNTSPTATGYGPYIDLVLPTTGKDGAGGAVDDGVTFVGATYLGVPVTFTELTFDGAGHATHPYQRDASGNPVVITGTAGDHLVVLQLPFGSFTSTQPQADVQVTLNLSNQADANQLLAVSARGGFRYGADALDNPTAPDPTIIGGAANANINPTLLRLKKTYIGPEDETATGPNFPRQYLIEVDIADGQTLTNLDVTDVLPGTLQYVGTDATTIRGGATATTAQATPSTTTPGGTLTRRFASVTGTTAANDATLLFTYYVPRVNASTAVIIDAASGDDATSTDDAKTTGTWDPIDPRDATGPVTSDATANDHTLTDKSIAIQKTSAIVTDTGATGPTPGDVVEYTLNIQVSDFFAFQNVVVTDIFEDGLRRDPAFTPTFTINNSGSALPVGNMQPGNATFVVDTAVTGATTATFFVSNEAIARALSGDLIGGCVPAGGTGGPLPDCTVYNDGATTFQIKYRVVIQEDYTNTFPSGDPSVDEGDVLDNAVSVQGDVLDDATLAPTGSNEADTSAAHLVISKGQLTKSIYAVNGSTSFSTPVKIGPGDTITYALRLTLPTSDIETFTLTDYLPLPIFDATAMTVFDATVSATAPPAGTAKFGPNDTFHALSGLVPTLTTDPIGNTVSFEYAQYDTPSSPSTVIEILLTVAASNAPFADGLFLTNQVRSFDSTTQETASTRDAIIQIELTEPDVQIKKGVVAKSGTAGTYSPSITGPVAFNAPGTAGSRFTGTINSTNLLANPVDSNLTGPDALDLVTFAIVLENKGSSVDGAFDVKVRDTLPAGFAIPGGGAGLNLRVTNGVGTAVAFTTAGTGLFDPAGGIELTDTANGAIADGDPANGLNIIVITYDLQLLSTVSFNQALTNTATLFNFAGEEGGPDHTTIDRTDQATVTTATPTVTKTLVSTDQAFTTGNNVTIGEQVTYQVVVKVPEGVASNAKLVDTLPAGLAIVSLDSLNASPGLVTSVGSFSTVLSSAAVTASGAGAANAGRVATLDFGTLTNNDTDNATDETLTITLTAVVINAPGNDRGATRANSAAFTFTGGSANGSAPNVTIVEPTLQVVKTALPTAGDAGDTITFSVTISHSAQSNADAFDVVLSDVLPAGMTFVSLGTVTGTAGTVVPTGNGFSAIWTAFPLGSSTTIQFTATLDGSLTPGQVLTNSGISTWTSLAGTIGQLSSFNTLSTERTGINSDPGGNENDYTASGQATVTAASPQPTKTILGTSLADTIGNNVAIGEKVQYQVQVAVPEGTSNSVTLVDTLDAGLAFVSFDSLTSSSVNLVTDAPGGLPAVLANRVVANVGGGLPNDGRRVTFNLGNLTNTDNNNGTVETITVVYTAIVLDTTGNLRGNARNNAAVWTTGGTPVNAAAPDVTIVEPTLQVVKTVSNATPDAGDTLTYTLTISHAVGSNADAYDVTLSDVLPAGLTYVGGTLLHSSGVAPLSLSESAGTISASFTTIAQGQTSVLTFQAQVDGLPTPITPGQLITNTAAIQWTSLPGDITAAQSTFNTFSVERTGNTSGPGTTANTYSANGNRNVTVNASQISGFVYVDANNDGIKGGAEAAIAGVTITLTGTDHLGQPVSLTTTTAPDGSYSFIGLRPGTYTVTEVQPASFLDGRDTLGTPAVGATAGNDVFTTITFPTGSSTTAINFNFGELATADLSVTKVDTQDPVLPGANLTYTIQVKNAGPNVATNAVLTDPLPGGTTFVSMASPGGWSCTTPAVGATGTISCSNPSFAVTTASFTVIVTVDPTVAPHAVLRNVATITSASADPKPENNEDDEPTVVAAPGDADLSVTKTDDVDPVTAGGNVTYTITVHNNGPATTDATVTDTVPAGMTYVSSGGSVITCALGNPFVCTIPGMAPGATETITITLATSTPGVVTNAVTVTGTAPDPNPANDHAEEPTTIVGPGEVDLAITKTAPLTVALGGNLVYTIVVTNRGPIAATGVTVADPLALPGLTFLANQGDCTSAFPCSLGVLNAGETRTIVATFKVDSAYSGPSPIPNTAIVSSATVDTDPTNNTAQTETLVGAASNADLSIVKLDSPDAAVAGSNIVYTLVVTNDGPGTATSVLVNDTLPAGVTVIGATASVGSCSGSGPLNCTLGSLAAGAVATIAVTVKVDSATPTGTTITNSATVLSPSDGNPANDTATQPTLIVAQTDLQIVKTGPATITPGAGVSYTLTVTNVGPSDALNVNVQDATPTGLTFTSNAGDCVAAFPCALGTVPAGATRTITATYAVPSGYVAPNPVGNTATVTTDTTDIDPSNNTSNWPSTLVFNSDVAITKIGPATTSAGNNVVYTLTITNNGPSDATGVQVTDPAPVGLTFVSNAGDCTTAFPCTIGALASGATRTITATFLVPSGYSTPTPILNTATVTSTTPDSVLSNNSDIASTTLSAPGADLSITKTAAPTVVPGNDIVYTITVHNSGPADAAAVTVADVTPTGLTFVSNAGDCATVFPCALGVMTAGETRTITATFHVPNGYLTPDPIVNAATVASSTNDPDPTNNTAVADVSVGADLSLTKNASPDPVPAGSNLSFTIVATNGGARDADTVTIADTVPAGTTFVSASPSTGGSCVAPQPGATGAITCTWTGPTVAGDTRTLILTVKVDPAAVAGSTITNTATTSSLTNDPDPTNNSATSTTVVTTAADIVITKTVDHTSPNVGDQVTYTVTTHNAGPSNATGIVVTDAMPPGLDLATATPSQGTYDAASGVWTVGALLNGDSAQLQIVARVTDAGPQINTATKTGGDQLDPDPSNNSSAASLTSNPVADIRVQKTADATAVNVGSTVTFTITASNSGPSPATGVRIADALPPGLTFVSAGATIGSYDEVSGVWEVGSLAVDGVATLTMVATVDQAGPIVNQAQKIALNELDPNPANDAAGATVNGLSADIQVVKTVSAPNGASIGREVTFFITASNNGPGAATGVRILDALPPGLAYIASTASRGIYVPQTGVWEIGALAATGADATATLQVRATVVTAEPTISNRASVMTSDQPDPNPMNNTSLVTLTMVPIDLADHITIQGDPSAVGTTVDFYVDVTNVGNATSLEPITVALPIPTEYRYHPMAQPGWDCTLVGRTVFCRSTATLAPGQSITVGYRADVLAAPPWGRGIFAHVTTGPDLLPRNDVAQLYIGPPPAPDPDMAIEQAVVVTGAGATKTLTYRVDVTNQGPFDAAEIVLTDVLPAGVTFVSATGPNGPCEQVGNYVACEIGSVFAGHLATATIVLTATAPGVVIHTLSTSSNGHDMYPRDNQSVLVQVLAPLADADTDHDGMPDIWESEMGLSAVTADASGDADGDGVSNLDEFKAGTHPRGFNKLYFAEGASNDFFTTTLSLLNPDPGAAASVAVELLKADGSIVMQPYVLAPLGRVDLDAATLMPEGGTFSTLIESDRPVASDRDMRWDRRGYGSTGESGIPAPSTTWFFAEGATNPYSLFYLLENPSMTQTANVQITYLLPGGAPPVVTTDTVAPHSRLTVFVNDLATQHPQLAQAEVAAQIVSTNGVEIVAERAMYLAAAGEAMGAGHAGQGATSPSTSWFFAEGATGAFFNEYVLLANPNAAPTQATVRYLLPDGTAFDKQYNLLPTSRQTIDVAGEDPRLASTSVSTIVTTTLPIVAERAMWWPGRSLSPEWYEAHVSLGATSTGMAWALAGGAAGGASAETTYALVANQDAGAGQARVTLVLDDQTQIVRTVSLAPTSRTTVDFGSLFPESAGHHFSALIESVGAVPVPIVVEWSRYSSPGGQFWGAGSAALATKVR